MEKNIIDEMKQLRIGFHYHIPAEKRNGVIYTLGEQGRFLEGLATQCEKLYCFLHATVAGEFVDYPIAIENIELVQIGPHDAVLRRVLFAKKYLTTLHEYLDKIDILLIRGPSPLLPAIAKLCSSKPVALLIVGDYLSGIDDLPQPRWRKELIRLWSWINKKQQLAVGKQSLTFVNSHKLFNEFKSQIPNLIETRTTTLRPPDFFRRDDTCQFAPHRILYTGRMDRTKGLIVLVEAVGSLIEAGENLILDFVGLENPADPILNEIRKIAKEKNITDKIMYHGYQTFGEKLFSFYKNADIFVMPSYAEGFPRAIWEAMAHSLPVIATKVGSIPTYLKDQVTALLIPARDVEALKKAILNLLKTDSLRQKIIRNGFHLAEENTLEKRSSELVNDMEKYIKTNE